MRKVAICVLLLLWPCALFCSLVALMGRADFENEFSRGKTFEWIVLGPLWALIVYLSSYLLLHCPGRRQIIALGASFITWVVVALGFNWWDDREDQIRHKHFADFEAQRWADLVTDCRTLFHDGQIQKRDTWTNKDPLPPMLQSLSPQFVQVRTTESPSAVIVNIQLSGGFQHHGYLVVCASRDPNYVPQQGRGWRIVKIAPSVFEYQE